MIGKTLGHYQITSQLGKGGMGEVFQAKDQILGRDVAIKVLPDEFAKDADRVTRFQREAKLLASLNHPNIAAIHGLEESGGTSFLVLELVEGQTLADRIKAGPIPVEESLKLALQIAEALEAAHEKGVIHRDLKPSNIKVTPYGKVKVLDFGLAKAYAGDKEEVNLSNSPTLSDAATQQGVILGTAAYMSPEQARGTAVDKRADIWAFGCVLFEMLTGRAAFSGKDVTDILAAVIRAEPEWSGLPANLHWRLREVLERCLRKDAKDRYHDISDVKVDIQRVLNDPSGVLVLPQTMPESRTRLRTILPWIAVAIFLTGIIAGVAVWKLKPHEPHKVMRFDYDLPEGQQLDGTGHPFLSVSPDGSKFVYNTNSGLYLRSMDQPAARLILGADKFPKQPFFSPDGQWIGYWSQTENQLKKISISGGAPVSITNSGNPALPTWGADDMIVYVEWGTGKIMRVPADGGTPELLCEIKGKIIFAPQILPDGKSVLFTQLDGSDYHVMVQSLKSGQCKALIAMRGTVSRYLPTGHIVYMVENSLFAVPFNINRLQMEGSPVSMVEGIVWLGSTAAPQYAISDSGTLVYVQGAANEAAPSRTLAWVDRKGKEEPLGAPPNAYAYPKISPDGQQVALTVSTGGNNDIWIWDIVRKNLIRLTFDKASDIQSIWTHDGKRIIFFSMRDSGTGLYWKASDGTGNDEKIGSAPDRALLPWSLSRDGKTLLTVEMSGASKFDIGTLSMQGDHAPKTLIQQGEYGSVQPEISPDGRWMAYASNESGGSSAVHVYVRPFPEVDKGKWQVSTGEGSSPLWSPDGRELFYLGNDGNVMAVAVQTAPTFSLGTPKMLFRSSYVGPGPTEGTPWDISPDGKRFLMMKEPQATPGAGSGPRKINIVLNWTEELKQRVPVK